MKKTILVFACVSLSLAVVISRSLAGPGTADAKGKAAVEKVLKVEGFTPTTAIEGPSNSVWFVAARVIGANLVEQVMVNVHGHAVIVQIASCQRAAQGWQRREAPGAVTDLQRKIEKEVGAEQ
jgi:hypothetical protein